MILIATIVDWEALFETGLAALIAGVGVAFTFSLAILGATRFIEARRSENSLHAALSAAMMLLGAAATTAAIVAGIIVMASG
jgi:hypothetical protein